MKTQWALIIALLFSLLIAVFAIVNNEVVSVNFLFRTVDISLVLLILGSAAAGAVIMVFLSLVRHVRVGFQMRELNKKINALEDELKAKEALLAERETEAADAGEPVEEEKVDCTEDVDVQEDR